MTSRLLILSALAAACVLPGGGASAAELPAGSTAIISGDTSLFAALPSPVNNSSTAAEAVDRAGRYVAFTSSADGLSSDDDDGVVNVYVKDRLGAGDVILVSRRTGMDGEPSHADCGQPAISADGARVAFTCNGPLDGADTNSVRDVYVRHLADATTVLASRQGASGPVGDSGSHDPSLDGDGDTVVFTSDATNLVNGPLQAGPFIYLRRDDEQGVLVDVVSRRSATNGNGRVPADQPSISDDGNRVAFRAMGYGTPVDPADTNVSASDVYVRDVDGDGTTLVSRADGSLGKVGDSPSYEPVISGDGSAVAFTSDAKVLTPDDTDDEPDVYRRSLATNSTTLVDVLPGGRKASSARFPTIDRSGYAVGFVSRATTFDAADDDPSADAYVKDLVTGGVELASRATGATGAAANADAAAVAISGNGSVVATAVADGRAAPEADPHRATVLVRDREEQRTTVASRPPGGAPFRNLGGAAREADISADGRYVAFVTEAAGLGLPDEVDEAVVVRDRVTGEAVLASRADGPAGTPLRGHLWAPVLSADGRRVAFVEGEGPGDDSTVWVRDLRAGRTHLASRANGANGDRGVGYASTPSLSADGSRVAFTSRAANLADGDADMLEDVHVRDLETHETLLASRADGTLTPKGNAVSYGPALSADGRRVAFVSHATNLGDGDTDEHPDVHVRDLATDTTRLASRAPGGKKSSGPIVGTTIDAAGERVAFATPANLLGADDDTVRVFVHDLSRGTLESGGAADRSGLLPRISANGRYVVYDAGEQVRRHDLATGAEAVVSLRPDGSPVRSTASAGAISGDGACVVFATRDTLFGPPSDFGQLYVRAVGANCVAPGTQPGPGGVPASGHEGPRAGAVARGGTGTRAATRRRDATAPVLSRVRVTRAGRGLRIRLRVSEPATLAIQIDRRRAVKRRVRAGDVRQTLTRRLRPGRHQVRLVARDAAGNRSTPIKRTVRIPHR